MFADQAFEIRLADNLAGVAVAVADEAGDEIFACCTRNWVFAGSKNFCDAHDIGVVEARAEIVEEG